MKLTLSSSPSITLCIPAGLSGAASSSPANRLKKSVIMKTALSLVCSGLVFAILSFAGVPDASASDCDRDYYSHNGSMMEIDACTDGQFTISYENPKSSLRKHGVVPGTLLFEGRFWESGGINLRKVTGTARLFKKGCAPALYQVDGYLLENNVLELSGTAPVRKNGCRTTSSRQDNLRFLPM